MRLRRNRLPYSPISSRPGLLWTPAVGSVARSVYVYSRNGVLFRRRRVYKFEFEWCAVWWGGQVKSKRSFIATSDQWVTNRQHPPAIMAEFKYRRSVIQVCSQAYSFPFPPSHHITRGQITGRNIKQTKKFTLCRRSHPSSTSSPSEFSYL